MAAVGRVQRDVQERHPLEVAGHLQLTDVDGAVPDGRGELGDERLGGRVVACVERVERKPALDGTPVARGEDRVERLDDAGARREGTEPSGFISMDVVPPAWLRCLAPPVLAPIDAH